MTGDHDYEAAGADALAEHFATATPAELIETMRRLGIRFFGVFGISG